MPKKKYLVTLTAEERTHLEQLLRGGKAATRKVTRARILLKAAAGWPDQRIAEALSIGRATVERTRQGFARQMLKLEDYSGKRMNYRAGERFARVFSTTFQVGPAGYFHP